MCTAKWVLFTSILWCLLVTLCTVSCGTSRHMYSGHSTHTSSYHVCSASLEVAEVIMFHSQCAAVHSQHQMKTMDTSVGVNERNVYIDELWFYTRNMNSYASNYKYPPEIQSQGNPPLLLQKKFTNGTQSRQLKNMNLKILILINNHI